jgi:hypothetical protein
LKIRLLTYFFTSTPQAFEGSFYREGLKKFGLVEMMNGLHDEGLNARETGVHHFHQAELFETFAVERPFECLRGAPSSTAAAASPQSVDIVVLQLAVVLEVRPSLARPRPAPAEEEDPAAEVQPVVVETAAAAGSDVLLLLASTKLARSTALPARPTPRTRRRTSLLSTTLP